MSRYQMYKYRFERSSGAGNWHLQIWLCDLYAPIMRRAFPEVKFDFSPAGYTTCVASIGCTPDIAVRVQSLLDLFKSRVLLVRNPHLRQYFSDEISECFALDFNLEHDSETGEWLYTHFGQLEHLAKEDRDPQAIQQLADALAAFCSAHPTYGRADAIVAVPGNPGKPFHLPTDLCDLICRRTGKINGSAWVRKVRPTERLQGVALRDKLSTLDGAITVSPEVRGRRVVLLDDLYQSGSTMWSIARLARTAGAVDVLGLNCVKSCRDSDNK
jgi:hypothetical protein